MPNVIFLESMNTWNRFSQMYHSSTLSQTHPRHRFGAPSMAFFNSFNIKNKTGGLHPPLCAAQRYFMFLWIWQINNIGSQLPEHKQNRGPVIYKRFCLLGSQPTNRKYQIQIRYQLKENIMNWEFHLNLDGLISLEERRMYQSRLFLTIVHPTFFHFLSHSVFFRLHCNALTSLICSSEI